MRLSTICESFDNLDTQSDRFFGRKNANKGIDFNKVLKAFGLRPFKGSPKIIGEGSTATVYVNPYNYHQVIKVTGDGNDASNFNKLLKKGFQHPSVAHCYNVRRIGPQAYAILLDRVEGQVFAYGSMLTDLIQGDNFEEPAEAANSILKGPLNNIRQKVLDEVGIQDSHRERKKLAVLFDGMAKLEAFGIYIFDVGENVIDTGDYYVLIDIGQ